MSDENVAGQDVPSIDWLSAEEIGILEEVKEMYERKATQCLMMTNPLAEKHKTRYVDTVNLMTKILGR